MILNPNKTNALVVSRSRTVTLHMVTWSSLCFLSELVATSKVKFDTKLTFEDHVRDIVSRVSQRIVILKLFRCYFPFDLPILEYCLSVWGSAAECHLQLFERQVYSVARLCPDQSFLS